jgi:glutathione peroxidase-family protein
MTGSTESDGEANYNQFTAYLIDTLGNIIMVYEAGAGPNHLRQDVKRLLTWSKLDEQY